jgi:hypothetical protein
MSSGTRTPGSRTKHEDGKKRDTAKKGREIMDQLQVLQPPKGTGGLQRVEHHGETGIMRRMQELANDQ